MRVNFIVSVVQAWSERLLLRLCAFILIITLAPLGWATPISHLANPKNLSSIVGSINKLAGANWPGDGVIVRFAAGKYRLKETMKRGPKAGLPEAGPLIIENAPNGRAVLSGAISVRNLEPVCDVNVLRRLPAISRGKVVQARLLEQGIRDFGEFTRRGQGRQLEPVQLEVFFNGAPMTLARWPDEGYANIGDVTPAGDQTQFIPSSGEVAPKQLAVWAPESDLQASGY
jgi:hypothetical protein